MIGQILVALIIFSFFSLFPIAWLALTMKNKSGELSESEQKLKLASSIIVRVIIGFVAVIGTFAMGNESLLGSFIMFGLLVIVLLDLVFELTKGDQQKQSVGNFHIFAVALYTIILVVIGLACAGAMIEEAWREINPVSVPVPVVQENPLAAPVNQAPLTRGQALLGEAAAAAPPPNVVVNVNPRQN